MQGSATVTMSAPAERIWNLIADVRNTGRFSPEVFESEWLGGATGPALGARFRGHVRRNEIGPGYGTRCRAPAAARVAQPVSSSVAATLPQAPARKCSPRPSLASPSCLLRLIIPPT